MRKFRFPTENGRNASFWEIRISGLICGGQRGGRARNSRKKAWGERGGVRALIRGCRSTVGCGQGKLKIGERRLRGVDGREDGRSEGSRTVDELLERESVVAVEMKKSEIGGDEIRKLGGFAGGRSGRAFSLVEVGGERSGRRGRSGRGVFRGRGRRDVFLGGEWRREIGEEGEGRGGDEREGGGAGRR